MRTSVAWCLAFLSATGHHSSQLVCTQSKSVSAMGVADEHSQLSIGVLSRPQKEQVDKQMSIGTEKRCDAIGWTKKDPTVSLVNGKILPSSNSAVSQTIFLTPMVECCTVCVCVAWRVIEERLKSLSGLVLAMADYTAPPWGQTYAQRCTTSRAHRTSRCQFAALATPKNAHVLESHLWSNSSKATLCWMCTSCS